MYDFFWTTTPAFRTPKSMEPLSLTRTAHLPTWTVTVQWPEGDTYTDNVRAGSAGEAIVELAGFLALDPSVFVEAKAVRS